jgi:hypothetical protein
MTNYLIFLDENFTRLRQISNFLGLNHVGKGIKVENFKVDRCLGVGHLDKKSKKNETKTFRSTKMNLVIYVKTVKKIRLG